MLAEKAEIALIFFYRYMGTYYYIRKFIFLINFLFGVGIFQKFFMLKLCLLINKYLLYIIIIYTL